jgi:osmoprotectant transport system permease protein
MSVGNFQIPRALFLWAIAAVLLFVGTFVMLEPNDTELVLARANEMELDSRRNINIQVGETSSDRVLVAYDACADVVDEDEDERDAAFTDQSYFDAANCEKVVRQGETVWFRINIVNESESPVSDFVINEAVRGTIPPTAECWTVEGPTVANRGNPDPGWGGGVPGALLANEDETVCIFSYEIPDDAEDPLTFNLDVAFDLGNPDDLIEVFGKLDPQAAAVTGQEGTSETVDDPDFSQRASTYLRVYEEFPLTPNTWLPTLGSDDETLIDISSIELAIPVFVVAIIFGAMELLLAYLYPAGQPNKLLQAVVRATGVYLIFWSFFGHEIFWDNFLGVLFPGALERTGDIELLRPQNSVIGYAGTHLELVIVSSFVIIPVGLLIGIFVTRPENRDYLPFINNIVNSGQTIPTLAVVAIMAPIIGLGFTPAIIALILYGVLPVVRNTIAGLEGVSPFMKDSALGMGMTEPQVLFSIELPIASRIIMAGIRTSMVINVGTAALGAYVASGGLGDPIAAGLLRQVDPWIVLGAVPAALLAILLDYILGRIEFVVTPRGLQIES